jgi:hypothetical protein
MQSCFVCEITPLFFVVLCVVRAVHQFYRIIIKKTPNKRRRVEEGHAVMESHVFDRIYMFAPDSSRVLRNSTHVEQVNCILLSK